MRTQEPRTPCRAPEFGPGSAGPFLAPAVRAMSLTLHCGRFRDSELALLSDRRQHHYREQGECRNQKSRADRTREEYRRVSRAIRQEQSLAATAGLICIAYLCIYGQPRQPAVRAPVKSVPSRMAPVRFAPSSRAFRRIAPRRSAPRRSAPFKSAPVMSAR